LLFLVPIITLFVCFQIIAYYYPDFYTIPFIDGKASVSQIGRGEKTIKIFKLGFLLYIFISIFFYFKISSFFFLNGIKNKFKICAVLANFFLCVYIIALGRDGSLYEISRRLAITFYIANIYINHIYLIKILKLLKSKRKVHFNTIYLTIFYIIIILMTILIIIGLPWVNPLFKYPSELKNIIEWNYFLLTIVFYLPLSSMFYQLNKQIKKL
tara:strand:- start:100 stop:735 length:636 start_codon:yes stop_codon:yes gene_type:complete